MVEFNEYLKDELSLISRLFALPKMVSLDGFIYHYYKSQIERSKGMPDERRERLDTINYSYILTIDEAYKLNNDEFQHIVKNYFYNFHNLLREFFS